MGTSYNCWKPLTSTPSKTGESLQEWGFTSPTSPILSTSFPSSSSTSASSSHQSDTSYMLRNYNNSSSSSGVSSSFSSNSGNPVSSFSSGSSSSSNSIYYTAAVFGSDQIPSRSRSSSVDPFVVKFRQPIENLFDQFDNDPSVQGMLRGEQFVKEHFQKNTYNGGCFRNPMPKVLPPRRDSFISSNMSNFSKESGPGTRFCQDPFSKFHQPPSPIRRTQQRKDDDSDYDHWF